MLATRFFATSYQHLLKPFFFRFEPEFIHDGMTCAGKLLGSHKVSQKLIQKLFHYHHPMLKQKLHGITFTNPVGLSAGFDKDANLPHILPHVGFGFMEIGSVTSKPYQGNPKPRLYRLPNSKGLVVYYGLKNIGVEKIIIKLRGFNKPDFPLSISVAKTNANFTASRQGGIDDYQACFRALVDANIGDFYTINISCPNTFGGEPFTTPAKLHKLLTAIKLVKTQKPIFIKMPLEPNWPKFNRLLEVIVEHKIQGVVISNLYKGSDKNLIKDPIPSHIKGGISGKPTWKLSNQIISKTYKKYGKRLTIIGVGGIFSAEDAYEKIKSGASLVELITGMIYQGPQLIGEINRGLVELCRQDGYKNLQQAVGANHRSW